MRHHLADQLRDRLHDVLDVVLPALVDANASLELDPTQTDERHRDAVDVDGDGHHAHLGAGGDDQRRPTGPPRGHRQAFADQPHRVELGPQVADGAAVETELGGEHGAARRPVRMHPGE